MRDAASIFYKSMQESATGTSSSSGNNNAADTPSLAHCDLDSWTSSQPNSTTAPASASNTNADEEGMNKESSE